MERSVFALELCARLEPESQLRRALAEVVRARSPDGQALAGMSLHQKWTQYRQAALHLLDHERLWERGCWDYFDNDEKARADFEMWSRGMITEEGARREPSGAPSPYRSEPRYLTFTMALLLVQGSPADRMMNQLCAVPEERLWTRQVFGNLLRGLGAVSFASVKSDVMYLIPGDDGWGLTAQDLAAPKFEYLRLLT